MSKPTLRLRPEDYDHIDQQVKLDADAGEFYAVVTTPFRGRYVRSIHVFNRQPTEKELLAFENLSSKIRIRGNRTDFEGSPLEAYTRLYNKLISRVYDVPVGSKIYGEGTPLDREDAQRLVPTMMKRRALNDTVGTHLSESMVTEQEEDNEGPIDPAAEELPPLPKSAPVSTLRQVTRGSSAVEDNEPDEEAI